MSSIHPGISQKRREKALSPQTHSSFHFQPSVEKCSVRKKSVNFLQDLHRCHFTQVTDRLSSLHQGGGGGTMFFIYHSLMSHFVHISSLEEKCNFDPSVICGSG